MSEVPHSQHPALLPHGGTDRAAGTRSLRLALAITGIFMFAEFAGALWTNSLALLADATHMLTDASALALSLFAIWFTRRPATPEKTYGYFRVEILAALVNGASLVVIAFFIIYEAFERFFRPEAVKGLQMLMVAGLGLAANLVCIWVLRGSQRQSLNIRGAFLHVIGDAIGSLGTIGAGVLILFWQALWADALVSVLVSMLILWSAWQLVRDSLLVLLEGTPSHVNLAAMEQQLCMVEGVESVHDLHVWTLTSGVHAMTCHAVVRGKNNHHQILQDLSNISREHFDVHHTTIQIEEKDLRDTETTFCH